MHSSSMVEKTNPFYQNLKTINKISMKEQTYRMTKEGIEIDTNQADFLKNIQEIVK